MNIDDLVSELKEDRSQITKAIALTEKMTDLCADEVRWGWKKLIIKIRDIKKLHDVRAFLRRELGSWNDKIESIWCSCGSALVSWNDPDHSFVDIRLDVPIDDFPKELKKPNCKFIETTRKEMDYVCEIV